MATGVKTTFANNLRRILKEKGIQQNEFAGLVGATINGVQKWMNGTSLPSAENLDLISNVINVEISELFIRDIEKDFQSEMDQVDHLNDMDKKRSAVRSIRTKYKERIGAGDRIYNEYAQPLGKVLPKIEWKLFNMLRAAHIENSDNKAYFPISLILVHLFPEAAEQLAMGKMIREMDETDRKYFNKQFMKIALDVLKDSPEITSALELVERLGQLDEVEIDIISSTINDIVKKKKSKKSVS